jgi:murein DD-endopeptidase MepM/ murein hydrolase activator NlpD
MGSFVGRANGILAFAFPEKRIFVQTGHSTRYLRLTPLSQFLSGTAAVAAVGWMAVATATVVIDRVTAGNDTRAVVLKEAYQTRLEELASERDKRTAEARSAQARFQVAMDQVSRQQTAILQSVEERRELSTALDLMRQRLEDAVAQRDTVAAANDRLLAQMNAVNESLSEGISGEDLSETLDVVSNALADAVAARDEANSERAALQQQVAELETEVKVNDERQDEMVDQIEQAVAASFGPLEKMFSNASVDVDDLLETVRADYSGQGGPLGDTATVSTRSFDDPAVSTRFDKLMVDLDRLNLLRVAADKVPLAMPVHDGFRFTSGYGYRRDPFRRGSRMHTGVDLAAPRGTSIYATADGVVVSAKYENGYGNAVRVQHELGFETVYAHLGSFAVRPGQLLSRGAKIGGMGSTGRSTGSHLHYEVRVGGKPVNPMTYLEAAKDVFQAKAN